MVRSGTARRNNIDNEPTSIVHEANLIETAEFLLWLRNGLSAKYERDVPIIVTSGYRSEALNALVGGSETSAHSHGLAADFRAIGLSTEQVFEFLYENREEFQLDQVINEYGEWIHIGLRRPSTGETRNQFLCARVIKNETVYTRYVA